MGCGSSKPRPRFIPLEDGEFQARFFKSEYWKQKKNMPTRYLVLPGEATGVSLVVVIRYNRGPKAEPLGAEQYVLNGNFVQLPASVSDALKAIERYWQPLLGLTSGWPPNFWMDAICVNEDDDAEVAQQRSIAQYIATRAAYTLDLTEPKARIFAGNVPYIAPVINFPNQVDFVDYTFDNTGPNLVGLATAMDNVSRVKGHQAGNLVWQAP